MIRVLPALLFFLFLAWVIAQANLGNELVLFNLIGNIPLGDKIGHIFLYGVLSALTMIAVKHKSIVYKNISLPMGALIVLAFAVLEELSQYYIANRNFELLDLCADVLGIYLWVLIITWPRGT